MQDNFKQMKWEYKNEQSIFNTAVLFFFFFGFIYAISVNGFTIQKQRGEEHFH